MYQNQIHILQQTISCSPSWAVRHIGNLLPEHFSTPKRAKRHLDFVEQTMEKQKKSEILQQQKRRLGKQILSTADLVEHLKEQKSLSDEVADTILEYLCNIKCSQK